MGRRSRRKVNGSVGDSRGYCTTSVVSKAKVADTNHLMVLSDCDASKSGGCVVPLCNVAYDPTVEQLEAPLRLEHSLAFAGNMYSFTTCPQPKGDESAADERWQKTAVDEIDCTCSTTSSGNCHDGVSSALDCEFEFYAGLGEGNAIAQLKLIFLDMDGPLAVWKDGQMHKWKATDSLDDLPYAEHVDALQRIISAAGGPETVKIVISSNWRTDEERYAWLVSQFALRGIDVIGHTDVTRMHPKACENSALARNMEIHRVLSSRICGESGARTTFDGSLAFTSTTLPDACEITSWIAIDDLPLGSTPLRKLDDLKFTTWYISAPDDRVVGNGWTKPAPDFSATFSSWSHEFSQSHFVKIDCEAGLAGTPMAEDLAIQLLCANDRS